MPPAAAGSPRRRARAPLRSGADLGSRRLRPPRRPPRRGRGGSPRGKVSWPQPGDARGLRSLLLQRQQDHHHLGGRHARLEGPRGDREGPLPRHPGPRPRAPLRALDDGLQLPHEQRARRHRAGSAPRPERARGGAAAQLRALRGGPFLPPGPVVHAGGPPRVSLAVAHRDPGRSAAVRRHRRGRPPAPRTGEHRIAPGVEADASPAALRAARRVGGATASICSATASACRGSALTDASERT
jgi:hypothetical protein